MTRLGARIREVYALAPGAPAVEFAGAWLSWGDLAAAADALDALLTAAGLGAGAAVGLAMRNRPGHIAAALGLLRDGRDTVSLNALAPPEALAADIAALRLPALIADTADWQLPGLIEAARAAGSLGIALSHAGPLLVTPVRGLEQLGAGPHRPPAPGIAVDMLTSGTTGPPKRIPISAETLLRSVDTAAWPDRVQAPPKLALKDSPALLYAPIAHISGYYRLLFALTEARPIVLIEKFSVPAWLDGVQRCKPKIVGLAPAALRMVLAADVPPAALAGIVAVSVGTAPLDAHTQDRFEARYNIPVLVNYGATELVGPVVAFTLADWERFGKTKRGSVGRPAPGTELRIVDAETGAVLPAGQAGLVEVRSDRFDDAAAWLRTTDIGEIDTDGFLFLRGRADDAIIRGGFKILPERIADTLRQHPDVADALVLGLPDSRLGSVPVAAVELRAGSTLDPAALEQYARTRLVPYMVPARFVVVDSLPRTPSMKISRPGVRALFGAD